MSLKNNEGRLEIEVHYVRGTNSEYTKIYKKTFRSIKVQLNIEDDKRFAF